MLYKLINTILITFILGLNIAANSPEKLTIEPYTFESSKKVKVDAEFGRLEVPENRSAAKTKTIEIAFVRFKSTSKNPGNPIIYLAGGPGGSGILSAKYNRFELFMAMREFGDVIALDQRGTWESKPNLKCANRLELPLSEPLTKDKLSREARKSITACAEDWESKGVDVAAYNTIESANDLNDLRKALGVDKVDLWGISYGTHLGLATIRLHGKHIGRAILAGVEGVDDTLKLPNYTENVIGELDRRLKNDPNLNKSVPDLFRLIKKVHTKLSIQPMNIEITDPKTKVTSEVTIGIFDLQYLLSAYSGSNEAQAAFPSIYYAMDKGDYSFVANRIAGMRKGRSFNLMSVAMDCASGISKERAKTIGIQKQTALFEDSINAPFPDICSAIKFRDLGHGFRKPVVSDVPVLMISGTLDGRTPVSNAEIALKGFKNGSHLVIDGAGHSDPLFLSSSKIAGSMFTFMRGQKVPKLMEIDMDKPFRFMPIPESEKSDTKQ